MTRVEVAAHERWDAYHSCTSAPRYMLQSLAASYCAGGRPRRLTIPRRVWLLLLHHPDVVLPPGQPWFCLVVGRLRLEVGRPTPESRFDDWLGFPRGTTRVIDHDDDVVRLDDIEIHGAVEVRR